MPDVVTGAEPYCTPAALLALADWRLVADWAGDGNGPAPTRASLLDPGTAAGANVLAALAAASGQVEAACLKGGRYAVADLQALTGNTRAELRAVVAGLAVWQLAGRRSPGAARADALPLAARALERVEDLRQGATVFGLAAQIAAGTGPSVVTVQADDDSTRTVIRARRLFGDRSRG